MCVPDVVAATSDEQMEEQHERRCAPVRREHAMIRHRSGARILRVRVDRDESLARITRPTSNESSTSDHRQVLQLPTQIVRAERAHNSSAVCCNSGFAAAGGAAVRACRGRRAAAPCMESGSSAARQVWVGCCSRSSKTRLRVRKIEDATTKSAATRSAAAWEGRVVSAPSDHSRLMCPTARSTAPHPTVSDHGDSGFRRILEGCQA
jgi:hypothetical protein